MTCPNACPRGDAYAFEERVAIMIYEGWQKGMDEQRRSATAMQSAMQSYANRCYACGTPTETRHAEDH